MGIFLMSQDKIASSSIRLRAAAEVTQCLPFNNSHVRLEQTDDRDRTDSCDGAPAEGLTVLMCSSVRLSFTPFFNDFRSSDQSLELFRSSRRGRRADPTYTVT